MYIYSRWSEKDMLVLSATNNVADLYELLGIYISYKNSDLRSAFKDYYNENVKRKVYHFRNIGEREIKKNLESTGLRVSRAELRLLSKTYKNIPVIASSRMGTIFEEIVSQVYGTQELKAIFLLTQKETTPQDFLYFQHYLVSRYVRVKGYAASYAKRRVFEEILEKWENNQIFSALQEKEC